MDDDEHILEALAGVLELDGYQVITANCGERALTVAAEQALDAILLDVRMPDMDGFQVLQRLQKIPEAAEVPVLFVTAEALDSDSVRRGLDLGARDYIPKPTKRPELLARIHSVVRIHRMERELRQMNASLREMDRRRHEYLAMASHDIRSPLSTVSNFCNVLLRGGYGVVTDDQAKAIQRMRSLVDYMRILVSNLLELEKAEEHTLRLERKPIKLRELFGEVLEMHRMTAEEKGILLETTIAADVGEPMLDQQRVLQVLHNLVGNALKFSGAGAKIAMTARAVAGGLELAVRDTGPGIPVEEQQLLFRPFQQLSVRSTTQERGAGLGLCIVKNLVELHGGTVSVESSSGHGTCFSLTFPSNPTDSKLSQAETDSPRRAR